MINPKQWDFTKDLTNLLAFMLNSGYKPRLAYVLRSKEEATRLGFPNSNHTRYLAADIDLFDKDGNYITDDTGHREFGAFWKSLRPENRWGGDFKKKDYNHYSREYNGVA